MLKHTNFTSENQSPMVRKSVVRKTIKRKIRELS